MPEQIYRFGVYQLHPKERQLSRDGQVVPLRGKVFDTLCVLVKNAGNLVRKDELMKAVWPDSVIEESNLSHTVCVLRRTLQSKEGGQRFIETVPSQGYRFVGEVEQIYEQPARLPLTGAADPSAYIAERNPQFDQLRLALDRADAGERQIVFVTGEAGIGKSTLVRRFLAEVREARDCRTCQGQCLDQPGSREAYMPLLEAFGQLCRQPGKQAVIEVLRHYAPTWLIQIPSAVSPKERLLLQRSLAGINRERMLREGVDAIQVLTKEHPLILVIEDLHWSDDSTLDFLSQVARGPEAIRLLLIGTYRQTSSDKAYSISHISRQLRLSELCEEITLNFLSEEGIASYLLKRLGPTASRALSSLLYRRTEGHPLLVNALLNSWLANGFLREKDGEWLVMDSAYNPSFLEVPESLRLVIESQVDRLPSAERDIVEAASLVGMEFSPLTVAAALNLSTTAVETACATLARESKFFTSCGKAGRSAGAVWGRYRFVHSLYREITYRHIPAGKRMRWHTRLGESPQ